VITARDVLRLLPDLIRLLRRLAADRSLPSGVRLRFVLLLAYLLCPIDLIPDFIPVLGYADDAIIVAIALRSVTHRAGPAAIDQHWPEHPKLFKRSDLSAALDRRRDSPSTRPEPPAHGSPRWRALRLQSLGYARTAAAGPAPDRRDGRGRATASAMVSTR
jgi:uncharacterized membrane protein YkvA (DUF1232 family)